ncbi:hypothetical protein ARMSODRAFT_981211 [Armillaria solidipes]|uniref:Uncharacterized protein n=1 Tax=Armillaria solidipes TaxID=1076256 RepID=A0A2H3AST6_9AGAR|nr:hypothetical protein ARMSODRAFT_981211 [Armillaria solidipes]
MYLPVLLVVSVGFTMHEIRKVENATSDSEQNRSTRRKRTRPQPFLLSRLPHLRRIPSGWPSLRVSDTRQGRERSYMLPGLPRYSDQFKFRPAASPVVTGSLKDDLEGQTPRLLRGLRRRRRGIEENCTGERECEGEGCEEVTLEDDTVESSRPLSLRDALDEHLLDCVVKRKLSPIKAKSTRTLSATSIAIHQMPQVYHRHQILYPSHFLRPTWNDTPPVEVILSNPSISTGQPPGALPHPGWVRFARPSWSGTFALDSYLTNSLADMGMWNASTRELNPVVRGGAEYVDHLNRVRFPTLVINGHAYIG